MSENENRTLFTGVLIIAVVFALLLLLGGLSVGMMGGGMGLGALLVVGLVLWLVYGLSDRREPRRYEYPPYPGPGGEYPMQVLDRKYARGEMTYEEYATLREEILRR